MSTQDKYSLKRHLLQETTLPLVKQWQHVALILTQILKELTPPIVYSRSGRHEAQIYNDTPPPRHNAHMSKFGNQPMVWIRKHRADSDPFAPGAKSNERTTHLEIGSDLHGDPSDIVTQISVQDILQDEGAQLRSLLTSLVEELK